MDEFGEAHVYHRLGEFDMSKMPGAGRRGIPTRLAFLSRFEGSESSVHET